ncbi:MAG: glycosyltransferase family 4 protein [ANME-2 cluster archaeon]|nr:glycosyltransferase family 4 protein [ANME-2 cluster archaeon]MBC2702443.1 glycosyltransferase family 4 protein [ANME-2 cluster archaeon]MBC2708400.1 glycosyltransferase family 4 protein [ANME-2 cluster archaeon]MBC2746436.1 glycosyltransferase family 4 protein [ANME-2 cluster archaeon]
MKICMLTTVHQPFDTRIFHKESKSLLKAGHAVTLIAPSDIASKNNVDGIHVITVKKPDSKILHPITMLRVFIAGLRQDCDVYHCHEPGSLFVCALLKLLKRNKLVYDVHEHYPGLIAENSLFPKFAYKPIFNIVNLCEKLLSSYSDYIITVDKVLASKFKDLNGKICEINNYPKLDIFTNTKTDESNLDGSVIYVGGLTKIRGTLETILAFKEVLNKIPDSKLIFVGGFISSDYEKMIFDYCHEHNLENNVIFVGQVAHDNVIDHIKNASLSVALLQPNPRYELAIPVKLFEYMGSSKPVVMSNFEFNTKLINEVKCGFAVDPTDIQAISDAILSLLEHPEEAKQMGENGRRAVEETYNWENMEKRLFRVYEELA